MAANPIIFGEVLFDSFPDGESVLGGAPFNVAWHLQGFGLQPRFLSSIGDDDLGKVVSRKMRDWGMDVSLVQENRQKSTGKVQISFNNGEPLYDICADQAYDAIAFTPQLDTSMASNCDFFYYGSLAARSDHNRATLDRLLLAASANTPKLMDVNLRPPWWQPAAIDALVAAADWVKLNEDELRQLTQSLPALSDVSSTTEILQLASNYREHYNLAGLIVTQGEKGALIMSENTTVSAETPKLGKFVNPVGAGDAFTAVFIIGFLQQWPLEKCLHCAQQFAAIVCTTKAAIIEDKSVYQDLLRQWTN